MEVIMKILLIAPASGKWRRVGRNWLFNGRTFRFSMLSLLSVAAETPPDCEIRIIDEQIETIPWNENVDLVGVTFMTALAPRAYEIADQFRARGVPVVAGGMHSSFCPQEALQHVDAVVVGEAEGVWPRVVEDARRGRMNGVYRAESPPDLALLKHPPHHLLEPGNYSTHAVQATRGCPHRCSFCAISAFHHHEQHRRPVDDVVEEVKRIPARFFIFVDDNMTADRDYACRLFEKLAPLNKRWVTQSTLSIAEDPQFVQLAAKAGCIGLFVGLESFSDANLGTVNKTCHRVESYRESMGTLHAHGIAVEAGIVFGFDGDDAGVFSRTLTILDELEVDAIQASIFTPLPGTEQFETKQNRILDRNWSHYDFHHVVFEPHGMSAEALQAGHDWVTYEFYRPRRIAKRLARHAARPNGIKTLPYVAAVNLAYYGRTVRWHIRGWNPQETACDQGARASGHLAQMGISSIRPAA
jgi:radical SAM superfamily enzyme YgiQ (UPF0313 family)